MSNRRRFVANLTVLVATTLVSLGVCEIAARMIFPAPPVANRQPPIHYRYDSEIRYIPVTNQAGWIDDGWVTINALGFRGAPTVVPKPEGRFRIVCIGDSVTLGWGVNDSDTFTARLEELLRTRYPSRDLDVVNEGVAGYNTRQEVVLFSRSAALLAPDLVLVGFYTNDVPGFLDDDKSGDVGGTSILAPARDAGQVVSAGVGATGRLEAFLRHSRLVYILGRTVKRLTNRGERATSQFSLEIDVLEGRDSPELQRAWTGIEQQLAALQSLARERHFAVALVPLPSREQVSGQYQNAHYQTRLGEIGARLGFPLIDPLPSLVTHKNDVADLYIAYDRNHPTAAGHRLIAQAVFDQLVARPELLEPIK
jgi:lysophospholipase L1-like esterase